MKVQARLLPKIFFLALLTFCAASRAGAQGASRLQMSSLDHLTSKASQTVVISVDERVLKLGAPLLKSTDPTEAQIKELLNGVKGIYVRFFAFDTEGAFSDADVGPIRAQLNSPEWSKIVEARSRKEGENVDVYIKTDGTKVEGIAVIAFNPKELTVVNVVGSVDLDKLSRMEGQFGIPDLELERGNKESKPRPR